MTVLTLSTFERAAKNAKLSLSERDSLIVLLEANPASGDLISGAGGARKLRLAKRGGGKRGGYRVITYFGGREMPVYLIDIYAKNVKTDLSDDERREIKTLCKSLLNLHREDGA